jgi:hypothetical protein
LGNFSAFERSRVQLAGEGWRRVRHHLQRIRAVAEDLGCPVVIAMVPAPIQVQGPEALDYFPQGVDLADTSRFDPERPQRMTRALAAELGLGFYDLREVLADLPEGPAYHSFNMHWTRAGHGAVARFLAQRLPADGWLPPPEPGRRSSG